MKQKHPLRDYLIKVSKEDSSCSVCGILFKTYDLYGIKKHFNENHKNIVELINNQTEFNTNNIQNVGHDNENVNNQDNTIQKKETKKRKIKQKKTKRKKAKKNEDFEEEDFIPLGNLNLDKESDTEEKAGVTQEKELIQDNNETKMKEAINKSLQPLHEAIEKELFSNQVINEVPIFTSSEYESIIEKQKQEIIVEYAKFHSLLANKDNEISDLKYNLSNKEVENNELLKQNTQLKNTISLIQNDKTNTALKSENDELKDKLKVFENKNVDNETLLVEYQKKILEYKISQQKHEMERHRYIETQERAKTDLKNEIKNKADKILELENNIQKRIQSYNELFGKHNTAQKQYAELYDAYNKLKDHYNILKTNYNISKVEEEKYEKEKENNLLLNKTNKKLIEKNHKLENEFNKSIDSNKQNTKLINELKEELSQLKQIKITPDINFYSNEALCRVIQNCQQKVRDNNDSSIVDKCVNFLSEKLNEMNDFKLFNKDFLNNYNECSETIPSYIQAIKILKEFKIEFEKDKNTSN